VLTTPAALASTGIQRHRLTRDVGFMVLGAVLRHEDQLRVCHITSCTEAATNTAVSTLVVRCLLLRGHVSLFNGQWRCFTFNPTAGVVLRSACLCVCTSIYMCVCLSVCLFAQIYQDPYVLISRCPCYLLKLPKSVKTRDWNIAQKL